jgi:hypothetical protein
MTKRKLNVTNAAQGSGKGNMDWRQSHDTHNFCPECKSHGSKPHKDGCKGEWAQIPAFAQLPKKNRSKKVWDLFIRKFVNKEYYNNFIKEKYGKDI